MNRDDIIRMAREAGFTWEPINNIIGPLERFAALVAAAEREECAKVAGLWDDDVDTRLKPSEAIRARVAK